MTTDIERERRQPAMANWGRWTVGCSTSWCTNAWMPGLGETEWICTVCGVPTAINWPPDPIAIEAILLMRPDPNSRNWVPGETLADLIMQNAEHGIQVPGVDLEYPDPAGYDVMEERDGWVVGGLVYGPVEQWRAIRPAGAVIALPPVPHQIGA